MQITPGLTPRRAPALVQVNQSTGEASLHFTCEHPLIVRARIQHLARQMLALPESDRIEMHVEHEVSDGMYMRKLFIPKGTLLVGKVHKKQCVNVVASGDISILTERGSRRVKAGFTGVSKPGTQKVGLAHEDTVFINVFRTDETDIAKIEAEIACEEHSQLPTIGMKKRELLCL